MTSQGLDAAIDTWLGAYSNHFLKFSAEEE